MSNIKFLGFLGLIGLLGLFTGNAGFYGFFGFFAFLGFAGVKNDEMLRSNLAKAGLNAFVVSLVGMSAAIAALPILRTLEVAALSIAGTFIAQIFTFVISFNAYEKRGG